MRCANETGNPTNPLGGVALTADPELKTNLEGHLEALPVLPTVVAKLMTLDRSAEDYADQVVQLIGAEPSFSARVIAAANSAASAPVSPITTIGAAVARIGSAPACNLIMAVGISRVFVPRDDWERSLWRHGLQVAFAARGLVAYAQPDGLSPEQAYTVGLLHDIGHFVLFQEAPDQLRRVHEGDWDTQAALLDRETEICGMNHAELGALACKKWSIPDTIANTIAVHHTPSAGTDAVVRRLAAVVNVADLAMFPSATASQEGYASADLETIDTVLRPQLPEDVAMSAEELHRIIVRVTEEADAALNVIGLG